MCYFRLHIYCCGHPGERKLLKLCRSGQLCPGQDRKTVNGSKINAECDRCRITRFMKTILNDYDLKDGFKNVGSQVRSGDSNAITSQPAAAVASAPADSTDHRASYEISYTDMPPMLSSKSPKSPLSSPWNYLRGLVGRSAIMPPSKNNLEPRQRLARLDAQRCLAAEDEDHGEKKVAYPRPTEPDNRRAILGDEETEDMADKSTRAKDRPVPSPTCSLCGIEPGLVQNSPRVSHECGPLVARCSRCSELLRVEDAARHDCDGPRLSGDGGYGGEASFTYEMGLPVMPPEPDFVQFPPAREDTVNQVRFDDDFNVASPGGYSECDEDDYDRWSQSGYGDDDSDCMSPIAQHVGPDSYRASADQDHGYESDQTLSPQYPPKLGTRERKLC